MDTKLTDALVFFGAMGDLTFEEIFPTLWSMAQIGLLDMLIITVTPGGRRNEDLSDQTRKNLETPGRGADKTACLQMRICSV
jgi:glucose-6-phosphate 1-dehydrogenase